MMRGCTVPGEPYLQYKERVCSIRKSYVRSTRGKCAVQVCVCVCVIKDKYNCRIKSYHIKRNPNGSMKLIT